jgi:hypothetical protein
LNDVNVGSNPTPSARKTYMSKCKGKFLGAVNYPNLNFFDYPKWSECKSEAVNGVFCAKHDNFSQRVYYQTDVEIEKEEDKRFFEALDKASVEIALESK